MSVVWSAASVRRLQAAFDYLEGESSGTARKTWRRIVEAVRRIGQLPQSGHPGRIAGTREAAVPRTPYTVVYQVTVQRIEILSIWNTAHLWPEPF